MADAGELKARATLENQQFLKAVADMTRASQEAAQQTAQRFEAIGDAIGKVSGAVAAIGALGGLTAFGAAALEASHAVELLHGAFVALNGATAETEAIFENLSALEMKSMFDFEDTIGPAAKQMMQLGVSAEDTQEQMTALVDAAAGLKQGPEWITAVSASFAEMQSHVVATSKDMKMLEKQFGPEVWNAVAKQIGTSVPEAIEKVKAGLVTTQQVAQAVTANLKERFAGAAEDAASGWRGAMHRLDQATEDVMVKIGDTVDSIFTKMAPIIEKVVEVIGDLAKWFESLPGPVKEAAVAVTAITTAVAGALAAFAAIKSAVAGLGLAAAFNPMTLAITGAVAALTLLGVWVYNNWPAIKAAFDKVIDFLSTLFSPLINLWKAALGILWGIIEPWFTNLMKFWKGVWDGFVAVGKWAIDMFMKVFKGLLSLLEKIPGMEGLTKKFEAIGKSWSDAQDKMEADKKLREDAEKAANAAAAAETKRRKEQGDQTKKALELAGQEEEARKKAAEAAKKAAEEAKKQLDAMSAGYEKLLGLAPDAAKAVGELFPFVTKNTAAVKMFGAAWDLLPEKLKRVIESALDLDAAFKTLGITSETKLRQGVADAEAAFWKLIASGKASKNDLQAAALAIEEANKKLAERLKNDTIPTFEDLNNGVGLATDAMKDFGGQLAVVTGQQLAALDKALKDTKKAIKEHEDAWHAIGEKTPEELQKEVEAAKKAEEDISQSTAKGSEEQLKARKRTLEATIEVYKRQGQQVPKEIKKELEQVERRLEESTKKQRNIWEEYFKYVKERLKAFGHDVLDAAFDRMFGPDPNAELKKQEAALTESLAERGREWDAYVQENAADLAETTANWESALAEQNQETENALAEAREKYDEYAADVAQSIEEIKQEHADAAAEEIQDARDALQEKQEDYAEYASEVQERIDEIHEAAAEALEEEEEDLRDSLRDRAQDYEDFVEDVNTKLSRLGEDTQQNIEDETHDTKRNIEDRQKDYNRYAEDTQRKIAQVRQKNKGVYSEEEHDLEISLKRKQEDLNDYVREQNEKLERYVRDQKQRQDREVADAKEGLDRKTRDYDQWQADTLAKHDERVQKIKEDEEQGVTDATEALGKKKAELDKFEAETIASIDRIRVSHEQEQEAEIAKQLEALGKKKSDYEKHVADILAESDKAVAGINADYQQTTTDLATELAKQKAEYEAFVLSITGPDGELAELKSQHTTIWTDIGNLAKGALSDIGRSLMHLASEEIIGALIGKSKTLKGVWDDISGVFDSVKGKGKDIADIDWGGPGTGGGGGGGGGGAGAAAGGLTGWISAISGVATAISSIVGNFQMAGMNKTLDLIENYTRYTKIYTGEQSDSILKTGHEIRNILRNFEGNYWGVTVPAYGEIITAASGIDEKLNLYVVPDVKAIRGFTDQMAGNTASMLRLLENIERAGPRTINVTVTATGVTTEEAARVMGNQIATNLTRQLMPQ
jgi:tape measure domain-containing protein